MQLVVMEALGCGVLYGNDSKATVERTDGIFMITCVLLYRVVLCWTGLVLSLSQLSSGGCRMGSSLAADRHRCKLDARDLGLI